MPHPIDDDCDFITELPDDWDGEGTPAYDKVAVRRICDIAKRTCSIVDQRLPIPHCSAGPDGGVDVQWRCANADLLVHFPPGKNEQFSFAAVVNDSEKFRGTFSDESSLHKLLEFVIALIVATSNFPELEEIVKAAEHVGLPIGLGEQGLFYGTDITYAIDLDNDRCEGSALAAMDIITARSGSAVCRHNGWTVTEKRANYVPSPQPTLIRACLLGLVRDFIRFHL